MTTTEKIEAEAKLIRYKALEKIKGEIEAAIKSITGPEPRLGNGWPFSKEWRDSRMVKSIRLSMSETNVGCPDVDFEIQNVHIPASWLGERLEELLQIKLKEVQAQMEAV